MVSLLPRDMTSDQANDMVPGTSPLHGWTLGRRSRRRSTLSWRQEETSTTQNGQSSLALTHSKERSSTRRPGTKSECCCLIVASYDHECSRVDRYDFANKRVAVIGGGSSSIQIVPELRKVPGTKLSVFVRNKTWITNRLGDEIMSLIGWDPKQIDSKFF